MAPSWCKVASNLDSHPKIRRGGRNAREVFLFALRRNAEPGNPLPGLLPHDELEPWYVADQLMMAEDEARDGIQRCVTVGLLTHEGLGYAIVGWDMEWGKAPVTGKERTAKWRETKTTEPPVTFGDGTDVTQRHGDACDALEEKRREEKRVLGDAAASAAESKSSESKPRRSAPSVLLPPNWTPRTGEWSQATSAGLDCAAEAEQFRDHHTAKGSRMVDWNAAFRTWIRNAAKFAKPSTGRLDLPRTNLPQI